MPTTSHSFKPLSGVCRLPRFWLGTWALGGMGFGPSDERERRAVLERALEAGISHLDTAGLYGRGNAERLIAKVVRDAGSGYRRQIFIASKGGLVWNGNRVEHRGAPADLRLAVSQSLDRLRTDYLDLFQLHWPDPEVPIRESVAALQECVAEGSIRHWGVGNFTAEQVRRHLVDGSRTPHQIHFNPVHRSDDILLAGFEKRRAHNLVYSPLEQGLLGDGQAAGGLANLGRRDIRRRNPHFHHPTTDRWVKQFHRLTQKHPSLRAALVLSWILSHKEVDAVLCGPRTERQLQELLDPVEPIVWTVPDATSVSPPPFGDLLSHLDRPQ